MQFPKKYLGRCEWRKNRYGETQLYVLGAIGGTWAWMEAIWADLLLAQAG